MVPLLKAWMMDVVQTIFRMIPHPTKPGLIKIGRANRRSPVLVTVNSSLTVRRLRRALNNENCYLLVAPAAGINAWCGSVGRHFTVESIISIVKTTRVAEYVDHRRLILPGLSAPGIPLQELKARLGWSAQFGPIRAIDIPEYLRNGKKLSEEMTKVRFPLHDRLEMAVAMSGSVIIRFAVLPLMVLGSWSLPWFAATVFLFAISLQLFNERLPEQSYIAKSSLLFILFVPLVMAASWRYGFTFPYEMLSIALVSLGSSYLVGNAFSGYTPFKQCSYSKTFYGYEPIIIDIVGAKCTGCGICARVCPVDCFSEVSSEPRIFGMVKESNCVECGACLVQCPEGAVINRFAESQSGPYPSDISTIYTIN